MTFKRASETIFNIEGFFWYHFQFRGLSYTDFITCKVIKKLRVFLNYVYHWLYWDSRTSSTTGDVKKKNNDCQFFFNCISLNNNEWFFFQIKVQRVIETSILFYISHLSSAPFASLHIFSLALSNHLNNYGFFLYQLCMHYIFSFASVYGNQ